MSGTSASGAPGAARSASGPYDAHPPMPFWRKYVFSLDHKVIGLQYLFTSLLFLLFGFGLIALLRWQLAFPGLPIPWLGKLLPLTMVADDGSMLPEFYNALGAMHGTIMVFLGIVPLSVGAFGNYVLPLQVGAGDMAFPRLNMMSYWVYAVGGVVMLSSFFIPGGAANSGWTSYPPLSVFATTGQTVWLMSMVFLITSSLLGSINFIVTTVQMRAKGLTFSRLPIFAWAQFVTSFLLLLAFPPLEAAAVLQLMDRLAGTSFFMPSGLVMAGEAVKVSGGGQPLLWQHLFWFLAHPEVYVLILPGMGIVSDVIANNTRRPLHGYKAIVGSILFLGFMSFVVWAHHMFLTGMGTTMNTFFMTTTLIISIPSVMILTALLLSLWKASIRFTVPMLFALAFLPMFAIGGLTGLPLGLSATDIYLHDTYYVIGHFHYVVAPGTIFAMFAGIYFWFPKMFGRHMNYFWGKVHFWFSLLFINGVFFPMFIMGVAGVQRRLFDPTQYAHAQAVQPLNVFMSVSAWCLAVVQVVFILNFFISIFKGRKAEENPWEATTLEWATPSPPPHGNFVTAPAVYRGPYEYGMPASSAGVATAAEAKDFLPQSEKV